MATDAGGTDYGPVSKEGKAGEQAAVAKPKLLPVYSWLASFTLFFCRTAVASESWGWLGNNSIL